MNAKLMKNMKKKKKGFTLVELIIVIAIIAILAAMALPKFSAVRLDARISNDVAAAKNIQSAAAIMVSEGALKDGDSVDPNATAELKDKIQGPTTPTATASTEKYTVDVTNGDVTVTAKGVQLAPAVDDTESKYRTAITTK